MINMNRRRFLTYGSTILAANTLSSSNMNAAGFIDVDSEGRSYLEDERIKQLAKIAVDAAVSAGASYADVRLTYTKNMTFRLYDNFPKRSESIGIGVRSLSDGYWGFASSPVWNNAEAARLGRAATENAQVNKSKFSQPVELAEFNSATNGSWIMPVEHDPFDVPFEEIADYLVGLRRFIVRLEKVAPRTPKIAVYAQSQDKYFFSSQNQFTHQRLYNTSAEISFALIDNITRQMAPVVLDSLTHAGMGVELFKNTSIRDYIRERHQEALKDMELSDLPIDVGRYPVLLNRSIVASLTSQSIGLSTELDRVLGFEANAGGTSYINSPEEMVGTLRLASDIVNITAFRSGSGSVGRVEWDDEGVKPISLQVVKEGKLVALQAPREGYSWMKEYHAKNNTQFMASGSMNSASGIDSPLVFSSDLRIEPDDIKNQSIEALRAGIKDGIEFTSGVVSMDFQMSTGLGFGTAFKIVDGKRVARLMNAGTIFRTTDLWKNIINIGRSQDVMRFGFALNKGEPHQTCYHSVYAPHMVVKEMDLIDVTRKA